MCEREREGESLVLENSGLADCEGVGYEGAVLLSSGRMGEQEAAVSERNGKPIGLLNRYWIDRSIHESMNQ